MCGLVGVAGDLATKDENLMKRLLMLDSTRGLDSTGLAVVTNQGEAKIAKTPSHPFDLFDMLRFRAILNGNVSQVFLGHNRAATRGNVNHYNAHPFECGHIIGAHNGTLDWSVHREIEKKLNMNFPTDSLALFAAIAEMGVEEAVSMLKGAWSITYVNLQDGTLNFLRNKERPMWLSYSEDFKKMYWASDWHMILAAVNLGNYNEKLYVNDKNNSFFCTEENVHYSFSLDELKKGGKKPKPKARSMEGAPEPNFTMGYSSSTSGQKPDPFKRKWEEFRPGRTTPSKDSSPDEPIILLNPSEKEPYAALINEEFFNQCVVNNSVGIGCSFCGEEITYGQQGITIFVKDKKVLCAKHSPKSNGEQRTRIYLPPKRDAA